MEQTKLLKIPPELNSDQGNGYRELMDFYQSGEQDRMFVLKGYAGTGKTFLLSAFVSELLLQNPYTRIAMTAPTNKAVQVLRQAAGRNDVTFKTIHSLLGLKEVIKDSGEIEFKKEFTDEDYTNISSFKIVIIDEVSMLADDLFYEIKRYNNECKIIMMGDPLQIPPVGKIDCEPFLHPKEHGIIEFTLTQIMRQADGSAIVENGFRVRENIANEDDVDFVAGKDLRILSPVTERKEINQLFISTYTDISVADDTKIIAWTNKKVDSYNQYIRGILFGMDIPKIMVGERLVMNGPHESNFDSEKSMYEFKKEFEPLTTNQEVTVLSVEEMVFDFTGKEAHMCHQFFLCYVAAIEFISSDGKSKAGRIKIIHETAQVAFTKELAAIKKSAIEGPTQKRKHVWKRYYRLLRSVADISYAYAITAHKAQGSTYRRTFIDVGNIRLNRNSVEANRILYTALTRAKEEAILLV